jgi:hypothetical protein
LPLFGIFSTVAAYFCAAKFSARSCSTAVQLQYSCAAVYSCTRIHSCATSIRQLPVGGMG